MRIVTYQEGGNAPAAGLVRGEEILPLAPAGFKDVISVLAGGDAAMAKLREAMERPASAGVPLSGAKLCAPVPRPPKFICVGLNYRDHALESGLEIPASPTIFSKFSSAVIGPGEPIVLPKNSRKPDYEAELAFVIGTGGRHIAADDWRRHVWGYMNANDVSARDYQMATSQWLMGKTFDTFAPCGPWLVSGDEIADPHKLRISLEINGERLQDSSTSQMIFPIPELVAYISSVVTLEPGDVVITGTPPGVGFARKPPRWLRAGDEVVVKIEGLGELRNPVVAEA